MVGPWYLGLATSSAVRIGLAGEQFFVADLAAGRMQRDQRLAQEIGDGDTGDGAGILEGEEDAEHGPLVRLQFENVLPAEPDMAAGSPHSAGGP